MKKEKDMVSVLDGKKPHAVCVPFPVQGHVTPMLKLAKLLHSKGFHITFVNTEYNQKRLLKSRGANSLSGLPGFQFETIPDGLPPDDDIDATQDIPALCDSISKNCLDPFRDLIAKLNNNSNFPPVSCIVSDGVMSFTLEVAEEVGVADIFLWTTGACGFLGFLHYPILIEEGLTPLKDDSYLTNGYLDTPVDFNHGIKDIRLRDLPSFIRTTDANDIMLNFLINQFKSFPRASAVISNSFEELEHEVLSAIRLKLKSVYTMGPVHLLANQVSDSGLGSLKSNLWIEEPECLEWLDSKAEGSVVYVSFGSIAVMTPDQMIEFAWGLANSKQTFLWIIRPDLVTGDCAMLPPEFVAETNERSFLASWCPQERVLNHPSIGCFLTHCGWNSTIESVSSGVPMLCWPFFADQQTNCRFACARWGIGMEIDNNVKRDDVESQVRDLMEGEKGKEMKVRAMEWKMKAAKAVAPGGSSYVNIDTLINEIMLQKAM